MKQFQNLHSICIALIIMTVSALLSGCSSMAQPEGSSSLAQSNVLDPTRTPTATSIFTPTSTSTVSSTNTPSPTNTLPPTKTPPPTNTPTRTATLTKTSTPTLTPTLQSTPTVPSDKGMIILQGTYNLGGLETQVQWLDGSNRWHNVENWRGQLDNTGRISWLVLPKDFYTGPFRWIVYNKDGSVRFESQSFDLPGAGRQYLINAE